MGAYLSFQGLPPGRLSPLGVGNASIRLLNEILPRVVAFLGYLSYSWSSRTGPVVMKDAPIDRCAGRHQDHEGRWQQPPSTFLPEGLAALRALSVARSDRRPTGWTSLGVVGIHHQDRVNDWRTTR